MRGAAVCELVVPGWEDGVLRRKGERNLSLNRLSRLRVSGGNRGQAEKGHYRKRSEHGFLLKEFGLCRNHHWEEQDRRGVRCVLLHFLAALIVSARGQFCGWQGYSRCSRDTPRIECLSRRKWA